MAYVEDMTNRIVNPDKNHPNKSKIFKCRYVLNEAGEKIAFIEHDMDGWWFHDMRPGKSRGRTYCWSYSDAVAIAKEHGKS